MKKQPVKIALSNAQLAKIKKGHPIQVSNNAIGHPQGYTFSYLHPLQHDRVMKANRSKKGVRLHLTAPELEGSGILDILKSIASPVLSGLAGVGKEIFPSHAGTIDKIREGIRTATGYGLNSSNGFSHGSNLGAFPANKVSSTNGMRKTKKKPMKKGSGIIPAGYY